MKPGHRIVLEGLHSERKLCDSFGVSEEFYYAVSEGDKVEYATKKGLLGVEWFYKKLRLVNKVK